jgi:hypothetical protein
MCWHRRIFVGMSSHPRTRDCEIHCQVGGSHHDTVLTQCNEVVDVMIDDNIDDWYIKRERKR